jgi:hypothetical protein
MGPATHIDSRNLDVDASILRIEEPQFDQEPIWACAQTLHEEAEGFARTVVDDVSIDELHPGRLKS